MTFTATPRSYRLAIRSLTGDEIPHPSQITGDWTKSPDKGSDGSDIYELMNWFGNPSCGFPHDTPVPAQFRLYEKTPVSETSYFACADHKRSFLGESPIPTSEV